HRQGERCGSAEGCGSGWDPPVTADLCCSDHREVPFFALTAGIGRCERGGTDSVGGRWWSGACVLGARACGRAASCVATARPTMNQVRIAYWVMSAVVAKAGTWATTAIVAGVALPLATSTMPATISAVARPRGSSP